ncbi:MAG: hypothetical protein O8C61_12100 [Candidatus Methanoperedens sp.]|nr:hypothetical protein [Candidatus Methanoperedens sp.]
MRFLGSENAVSEVVGYALILALTVTGVGMIVLVGVPSIYQLQDMTNIKDAEQAFTMSSFRASGTLLGDAPMRVDKINLGGGTVTLEPNMTGKESYVTIKSANGTFNINISMGKVKYSYGERILGYEGGGVWSKYPSGGSVMLSPPEFHFDGKTLTFAVLTVNGNTTVGGKGTAEVIFKNKSTSVLFPTTDPNKQNPLNFSNTGKVYVNITSDFYDAWADYARSLSYTSVKTNSTKHTANIELTVVPSTFGGTNVITNPINFPGIDPSDTTPLDNFSFKIIPSCSTEHGHVHCDNKLNWDIRGTSGNKTLIFYFKSENWDVGNNVDLSIGYIDKSSPSNGETWLGSDIYTIQPDYYIYVDLLNKSTSLTYIQNIVGSTNANVCKTSGEKITGIDNPALSWGSSPYINVSNVNRTQTLYNITEHYFWEMSQTGTFFFNQCSPGGNQNPDPSQSSMIVNYNATGDITFLHISNNIADVSIN